MLNYRVRKVSCSVTIPSGQTSANASGLPQNPDGQVDVNGLVRAISINAPAMTGTSYTFTLSGAVNGMTLFNKASLAPNTTTTVLSDSSFAGGNAPLEIPVEGAIGISITSNGTESTARTFTVTLLIDRG